MRIKLKQPMSGHVNLIPYPPVGVAFDVPDDVGADLCSKGFASPVKSERKTEKAVPKDDDVETRAAEKPKRGPGRPRKAR